MTKKTARNTGFALYGCLMMCIPAVIYLEMHNYLWTGVALIGLMFAMAMGLLWVSEVEDQAASPRTVPGQRRMGGQG